MLVPNYYGTGQLTFSIKSNRVVRVSSSAWLLDRVRFVPDGFRRQRVSVPLVFNQPATWTHAVAKWYDLLVGCRAVVFGESYPTTTWLTRSISFLRHRAGRDVCCSVNRNVRADVYVGSHGLSGAETATLVLPTVLPYEETGVLTGPAGVPQVFKLSILFFQLICFSAGYSMEQFVPVVQTAINDPSNFAVYQASPLQRLINGSV